MNRLDILNIINDKVYEGMHTLEQIMQDLDDSIDRINEALNTTFPYISEIMTDDTKTYSYAPDAAAPTVLVPIFPEKYLRSVCINYTIKELMGTEDEFGMLYQTALQKYLEGIDGMFSNYFNKVPDVFKDEEGGFVELDEVDAVEIGTNWGFDT